MRPFSGAVSVFIGTVLGAAVGLGLAGWPAGLASS